MPEPTLVAPVEIATPSAISELPPYIPDPVALTTPIEAITVEPSSVEVDQDDEGRALTDYVFHGVDSTPQNRNKRQLLRAYWVYVDAAGKYWWDKKLRINIEVVDRGAYMNNRELSDKQYHVSNSYREDLVARLKLVYSGTTYAEARAMGKVI